MGTPIDFELLICLQPERRCQYLSKLLEQTKGLEKRELGPLCQGILGAYSRYYDYKTQAAVLSLWRELFDSHPEAMVAAGPKLLQQESTKLLKPCKDLPDRFSSIPFQRYLVLTWSIVFFKCLSKISANSASTEAVLKVIIRLVDSLGEPDDVPPGLRNATKREVKSLLKISPEASSFILSTSLKALSDYHDFSFLAILLKYSDESSIKSSEKTLIEAYVAKVLNAKAAVPLYVTESLHDFFAFCMTEEKYTSMIKPTADRMLLRAPEVILQTLNVLYKSLSFDLSGFMASQLVDQLLASYQSTTAKTRQDAFNVFSTLARKSTDKDNLLKAVEKVSKAITSKISSWEQRSLVYKSAGALGRDYPDANVSNALVKSIILAFPKETHEYALNLLSESLSTHLLVLVKQEKHLDTIKAAAALLERGLKQDKPAITKAHVKVAGQTICSAAAPNEVLVKTCVPLLATIAEKIQASPSAAGSVALEGYIALAVLEKVRLAGQYNALLEKSKYYNLSVYSTAKASKEPTFLVNDRMLSKLSEEEEYYWLLRALDTIGSGFNELSDVLRRALCQTLVAVTAAISSYETIQMANRVTSACGAASSPEFGQCLISCMMEWLQNKPTLQAGQASRFRRLLVLLFSGSSQAASVSLAVSSFVLAAHPSIRPSDGSFMWVSLVSQARLDIAEVVSLHSQQLMDILRANLSRGPDDTWWGAALEGAKLLAFISPEKAATTLMTMAIDYLQPTTFSKEDVAIWKTPQGTMYRDVLKKGHQIAEDQNRKGAALDKWEREVREQLAAKKGNMPKLTKEEQELVTAQLAREASVREAVQTHFISLQNGILLTKSVVGGFKISGILYDLPAACEPLLSQLLMRMFGVVQHKLASSLLRGQGVKGWLDLSIVCAPDLNDLPTLTSVAALRSYDVPVPLEWQGEPLEELLSRLLFRLQMLTSRKRLDPAGFSYMFPLLERILLTGGVGFSSDTSVAVKDVGHDDDQPSLQVEQVTLALDVLGNHASLCANVAMPRLGMIGALLRVIETQPKLTPTALDYLLQLSEGLGQSAVDPKEVALLANGLLSESLFVRKACLQSLGFLNLADCPQWANLWIICFSPDTAEKQLATSLWEDNSLSVPVDFCSALCSLLTSEVAHIRTSTANSFHEAISIHPSSLPNVFDALCQLYFKLAEPIVPEYDRFGMLIQASLQRSDPFGHRVSVGLALGGIVPLFDRSLLELFLGFMISQEALADLHADVRKAMLQASLEAIHRHGQAHMKPIMAILQHTLDQPDVNSQSQDYIREGAVILYGTLACNLKTGAKEIPGIISKLIQTLDTPSESVQFAVAECLPPLVLAAPTTAPALIQSLLDKCINSDKFAKRRGAAFGLAGVVKGRGLTALKEFDIMATVYEAAKSKKAEARQGSMFALETLCELLGRQFEPYVIQTLPFLLICFSDSSDDVRRATLGASRVIMSKLSGHGIKRTLPSLLEGLEDYQWRTKRGAIELLGSMAYCAPHQLSLSLPTIVPRLIEVLNDSHHMVKGAADSALASFTDVISNPEIQSLMPQIMDALSDPNSKTQAALKALLDTPFMHYLDAPSLALLVPILQRGLRERSTDVKCKSSQIVGNMASLTDQKDLVPYLPGLMPGLMEILVDPVPEARSTSAKSLGIMVAKLGEINFPDLISELVRMLRDNISSVDRSGAAQGLSEILSGLDISRMEGLLPEILANTQSPKATTREGFTTMLIYLPATFGLRFKPYLPKVLSPVLNGLADDSEYVRDASLRAGQIIITNYSDQAINLLLPELQRGIFEPSWRIRQASAQLMGDLLFNLMGITVKLDAEEAEDEEEAAPAAAESSRKALLEILGQERRDSVLAGLYLIRADTSAKVRQVASAIWKLIVSNTPRTLKEILPVVMANVLRFITSPIPERQYMAAGSLADLVRRVGESGLKKILPILHVDLDSAEFEVRKAAVVALSEMIGVLGKSDAADFLNVTTLAVLKALCDPSSHVRETAARTFDVLHQHIGPAALEAILPPLLDDLKSGRDSNALEAIQELVSVRANVVLPAAIPSLLTTPISRFDALALRALVVAGGAAINNRLRMVLPPLLKSCSQADVAAEEAVRATLEALLAQVDNSGLEVLLEIFLDWIQSDSNDARAEGCAAMATFFRVAQEGLEILPHVVDWIRILVPLYRAPFEPLMRHAGLAFSGLIKCLDKSDLDQLVIPLRQTVKNTVKGLPQDQNLAGFCQPKAIAPFLSVYLQGLMFSSSDVRERSASSLGEVVARTSFDALKPFVTQITGPLIRIIGERYPAPVKVSILDTLYVLFGRAGSAMRPFLPQLQRTFIKSLGDVNSAEVRARAEKGLAVLIDLLPRVDPLCTELVTGCRSAEETDIRQGFLRVLLSVVTAMADKLTPATKDSIRAFLTESTPESNFKEKTCAKSILALI